MKVIFAFGLVLCVIGLGIVDATRWDYKVLQSRSSAMKDALKDRQREYRSSMSSKNVLKTTAGQSLIKWPFSGVAGDIFAGSQCETQAPGGTDEGYFECSPLFNDACGMNAGFVSQEDGTTKFFWTTCEAATSNDAGTPVVIHTWSDIHCTNPLPLFNNNNRYEGKNTECSVVNIAGNDHQTQSMRVVGGTVVGGIDAGLKTGRDPAWFHGQFCDNPYCNETVYGSFYYDENQLPPGPYPVTCEGPYTIDGVANLYANKYSGIYSCPTSIGDQHCFNFATDSSCRFDFSPSGLNSPNVCFTTGASVYKGGSKNVWVRGDCSATNASSRIIPSILTIIAATLLLVTLF